MKYAVVLIEDTEGVLHVEYVGKDRSVARITAKTIAQNPPKNAAKVIAFGDVASIYAKRIPTPVEPKEEQVKPKGTKA